jgi:MFS family permease
MKLIKLSFLLGKSRISSIHKKYIFIITAILCLEYLDLIIYIKNARVLTDLYLSKSLSRGLGIFILFMILWLANFLAKSIAGKLLEYLQKKYDNATLVIASSIVIICSFSLQALILLFYCNKLVTSLLIYFFFARLIYQLALAIIIHDTYEFLLNTKELSDDFISLILNSLELSVLISIVGYKTLLLLQLSITNSIITFILFINLLWLIIAIYFAFNYQELNQINVQQVKSTAAKSFSLMLKHNLKDTLTAFSIVGVRSSLCIISVIYMPIYLIGSLHFVPKIANDVILTSSFLALSLCFIVDKYVHKYNHISIVRNGLVGLIIGSLISYSLLFFKVIPFLGITILIVFQSLFALCCPLILNKLFEINIRQLAIVSCYRNSFLVFASFTFLLLSLFTEIFTHYIAAPAIFLISVTAICYFCLIIFNKQSE